MEEVLTPGSEVTLQCSVAEVANVEVEYRWTRNGVVEGPEVRSTGDLVVGPVTEDESHNGLYECHMILTATGITAAPLLVSVGSTLLSVGGECLSHSLATEVL